MPVAPHSLPLQLTPPIFTLLALPCLASIQKRVPLLLHRDWLGFLLATLSKPSSLLLGSIPFLHCTSSKHLPANMSNEAATVGQDDLTPEQTEGFKVGEKKTIAEYQNLGKCLHRCIPVFCTHIKTDIVVVHSPCHMVATQAAQSEKQKSEDMPGHTDFLTTPPQNNPATHSHLPFSASQTRTTSPCANGKSPSASAAATPSPTPTILAR